MFFINIKTCDKVVGIPNRTSYKYILGCTTPFKIEIVMLGRLAN